jgi:hypothetical protein
MNTRYPSSTPHCDRKIKNSSHLLDIVMENMHSDTEERYCQLCLPRRNCISMEEMEYNFLDGSDFGCQSITLEILLLGQKPMPPQNVNTKCFKLF